MSQPFNDLALKFTNWVIYSVIPLTLSGITFFLWSISSQISILNTQVAKIQIVGERTEQDTTSIQHTQLDIERRISTLEAQVRKQQQQ